MGGKLMAKTKQYVFSTRTTEEGLKRLNELKANLNIGWDELVIDGMCGHYNLDKAILTLPKKEAPAKSEGQTSTTAEPAGEPPIKEQETKNPPAKKKGNEKKGTDNTIEKVESQNK
jgi:hypothetical protein